MTLFKNKSMFTKLAAVFTVLILLAAVCAFYLGDYYHADMASIEAFTTATSISAVSSENGNILLAPEGATAGLIFYPGGKVEHTAYIPLMQALAEKDILCVLVEMPFRLAVFDVNAAAGIPDQYPQIESWYIGGHSLGGSMAASHLSEHAGSFDGLILLGSYSTADLSETGLSVLSVYGSEDGVLNREKYEENRKHLPGDFQEIILDGGCHAYFGMYGFQAGDGTPLVTNEAQIRLTADAVAAFMSRSSEF